jgi:hypothetical protein
MQHVVQSSKKAPAPDSRKTLSNTSGSLLFHKAIFYAIHNLLILLNRSELSEAGPQSTRSETQKKRAESAGSLQARSQNQAML